MAEGGVSLGFCNFVAVALRLEDGGPRLVLRRELGPVDPARRHGHQIYHAAAEAPDIDAARALLARGEAAARAWAERAVAALVAEAAPVAAGMTVGAGVLEPALERLLASHIQLHMAEGVLYREVVAEAVERRGLAMTRIHEKRALAETAARVGLSESQVRDAIAAKAIGAPAPWRQAEKHAALAAWAALAR
jgi:hypothetical protein